MDTTNNIVLPKWLDDYIFGELGAKHEPQPFNVVYNPDQPFDFVQLYLGTYFPRSYAESYHMFSKLFKNKNYKDKLMGLEEINILDFCCAMGGEIFGLIKVLEENLPNLKRVYVKAFDANDWGIIFLAHIFEQLESNTRLQVFHNENCLFIAGEQELDDMISMTNSQFQFVLSFKALNEFIQSKTFPNENIYYKILNRFSHLVASNGLLAISDVTTKTPDGIQYYPTIMNSGFNKFVKERDFKTIKPTPCYFHENLCNGCYMQDWVNITHSRKLKDLSKIAYRIVCLTIFADEILKDSSQGSCRYTNQNADKNTPYC